MIQSLVIKNVNFITRELNLSDKFEIDRIRYGVEVLIGEFIKMIIIYSLSILANKGTEFFIILAIMMSIRSKIGGSHAKNLESCLIVSTLLFFSLYFVSSKIKYIPFQIESVIIILIITTLSRVKYKTKVNKHHNDKSKDVILRIKLISVSIIFIIISKFIYTDYYSIILLTELFVILDYLNMRRK